MSDTICMKFNWLSYIFKEKTTKKYRLDDSSGTLVLIMMRNVAAFF